MLNNRFLSIILSLLLTNTLYAATILKGVCVEVLDGDTYKVKLVVDGKSVIDTVRCSGIDAPEKGQQYANESRELLEQLILNREVFIKFEKRDVYNRIIGRTAIKTSYGNIVIEKLMLDAGCAWHFRHYSNDKELQSIEDAAKSRKVGLWKQRNPMPPWDYRQKRKGGYAHEKLIDDEPVQEKPKKTVPSNKKPIIKSTNDFGDGEVIFDPHNPKKKFDIPVEPQNTFNGTSGFHQGSSNSHPFPSYSNVETKKEDKYWYNTETGVYHRRGCQYFGCPQGIPVDKPRGRPCQKCGG